MDSREGEEKTSVYMTQTHLQTLSTGRRFTSIYVCCPSAQPCSGWLSPLPCKGTVRSWRGWVPRPVRDGLAGGLTLMNAILLFDLVFPFQSPRGGWQARVTHRIKSFLSGSIVKQKGEVEGVASLSPSSSICKGEGNMRLWSHRPVTLGLRTPGPG